MHSISQPDSKVAEKAADQYHGTPLGVEAAWCPNGMPLPPAEL